MGKKAAIHKDRYGKVNKSQLRYRDILEYNGIQTDFVDSSDVNFWDDLKQYDYFIYRFCVYDDQKQIARKILPVIENYYKIQVFPSQVTSWSYDDKIKQYFLLQANNFPVVESWVFFDKKLALKWAEKAEYPLVFKLKSGSRAQNVILVNNKRHCAKIIRRMFRKGTITENVRLPGSTFYKDLTPKKILREKAVKLKKMMNGEDLSSYWTIQKNYCIFQKFLSGNDYDTRITTIGDRAFGFIRHNRKNDFRASGSGKCYYDIINIDLKMVEFALRISKEYNFQSMAYDFIYDYNRKPKIIEMSYTFPDVSIDKAEGFWDSNLNFHPGHQCPQCYHLIDLLNNPGLKVPDTVKLDIIQ
jgi:glutathione synthase/RimK-type ligase-like ATP-grasp enzyme